jgi:hypothetical protein
MHRVIRDHLEEVLAQAPLAGPAKQHLEDCKQCRDEVMRMRDHALALRSLRPTEDIEPRPGFYARVMERIEAQGPASIWSVFSESPFGRRIAVASMALALAIGVYLFSAEQPETGVTSQSVEFVSGALPGEDQPGIVLTNDSLRNGVAPDRDAVLVNLVTYREQ